MTPLTVDKPRAEYSSALVLANSVLFATSAVSVAWCMYSVAAHKSHLYLRLAPALIGIAAPLLLRLKPVVRLTVAAMFIGAGLGLYLAQFFALVLVDPERPALQAVQQA